ncbi:MAG: type II toxin-antitoxin system VapC family toxin [Rubrobacter sp.]|nr:type II toxin-antitoxin system VapC family toxin [Rubrobacter sp.]
MSERGLRPLVLDTNVAVKWHLNEEWSEEASDVLASVGNTISEFLAPGTIQPEFFNTLWQRQRRGDITPDEVRRGWEDFVAGEPITLYAPEDLMPRAAEIVLETGVIVYDALFLALAEDANTVLVTADEKLLRIIENTVFANLALPLANFPDLTR